MARSKPTPRKRKAADEEEKQQQQEASGAAATDTTNEPSIADLKAELTVTEAESKRRKSAIDAIVKEYSCPLSLELPVEPVIAEDGRTYNRADIQKHIDNAHDPDEFPDEYEKLRSPVTNEKMGPKLVPAVQVQNMIRSLVESGAIDKDDAKHWEEVDDVRTKANNGDAKAMLELGDWYYNSEIGLVRDLELSFSWIKRSADRGYNPAKADAGIMLYKGEGTKRRCADGALLLGLATTKGSSRAAYYLAELHYQGGDQEKGYFTKDIAKAKFWLDEAIRLCEEGDKSDKVNLEWVENLRKDIKNEEKEDDYAN